MNEHDLYAPIMRGARLDGLLLHRLHDGSGMPTPFDIEGVELATGRAVALEVKVERAPRADGLHVDWGAFEPHQLRWLRAYAEAGAHSLAAVYRPSLGDMTVYVFTDNPALVGADIPIGAMPRVVLHREAGLWRGWHTCVPDVASLAARPTVPCQP